MKSNQTNLDKVKEIYAVCRRLNISKTKTLIYIFHKFLSSMLTMHAVDQKVSTIRCLQDMRKLVYSHGMFERESKALLEQSKPKSKRFIWFVPKCSNVWGGGHYTIFRFANYFSNQYGVDNIIYFYNHEQSLDVTIEKISNDLNNALPNCKLRIKSIFDELPDCDAVIATTWQSAYHVDKFSHATQKFYFMQDYESLFYPAGTNALQANYTYSFGFKGITGGLWLKELFQSYGGKAQEYIFSADRDIFYPSQPMDKSKTVERIFFYGRPSTERRAFELGMSALDLISQKHPNVEIIIAGLDNLDTPLFPCTLKGNLSLKDTGSLYRTCDIGIALSATNLSYLPVELMASGCAVVTNGGPQVEWFCQKNHNAMVVAPTAKSISDAVSLLINDPDMRYQLISNGLKTIEQHTWEGEMDKIFHYINKETHQVEETA